MAIDTPSITPDHVKAILKYLPYFERRGQSFGTPPDVRAENGVGEIIPALLSQRAAAFVQTCYDSGFVQDFDWPTWQGEAARLLRDEAAFFRTVDLGTLVKLLTTHIRKDRFVDGHLLCVMESGHISRILCRLRDLFIWIDWKHRIDNGYNADPAYWLLMDSGKFDLVYRPKSHSTSGQVTLASYGAGLGSGLCRLEMVGTVLKGYHAGVQRISATDATLADPGRPGLAVDYGASADNFAVYTEPVLCPTESITSLKDQMKLELSVVANYDSASAAIGSIVLPARSLVGFRLEVESLDAGELSFIDDAKSKKAVITIRRRASTAI